MNYVKQYHELSVDYPKIFIKLKAQEPNILEATVIAAAIEGLDIGQCASHFTRLPLESRGELFGIMNGYAKFHTDYMRRKVAQNTNTQVAKIPMQFVGVLKTDE